MHQHAVFRLQLQQQLLREGSQVQIEHATQQPGWHEQQRCVMPDDHQHEANAPGSCTVGRKPLQGSSLQSLFSLAGSRSLGPPPASEYAAYDNSVAADAEEYSTASAAAQVRSIWTTAGCCNLCNSQLLCPDSLLCAQGRVRSTGLQQRAAPPHHAAQRAPLHHHWSLGDGGELHAGKEMFIQLAYASAGMAHLPQGLTSMMRLFFLLLASAGWLLDDEQLLALHSGRSAQRCQAEKAALRRLVARRDLQMLTGRGSTSLTAPVSLLTMQWPCLCMGFCLATGPPLCTPKNRCSAEKG